MPDPDEQGTPSNEGWLTAYGGVNHDGCDYDGWAVDEPDRWFCDRCGRSGPIVKWEPCERCGGCGGYFGAYYVERGCPSCGGAGGRTVLLGSSSSGGADDSQVRLGSKRGPPPDARVGQQ